MSENPLTPEERSALLERVATSSAFQRSQRSRELLQYLAQATPKGGPGSTLSEHQIGIEVFGREPGFDSSVDTIVRVQVSQLRKKLQAYFLNEGSTEPVILDLPKGSYTLTYLPRQVLEGKVAPSRRLDWVWIGTLVGLLAVAFLCVWLAYQNSQLRASIPSGDQRTPSLDQFWRSIFPSGTETQAVLSDANLMILSDMMGGRTVTLFEYRYRTYPANLFDMYIKDPKMRLEADHISGTHLTPVQDAEVLRGIVPLSLRYRFPLDVVFARNFRMESQVRSNLILLGHKRGNPWIEMFEPMMNFRYQYGPEAGANRGMLVNQAPLAGEQRTYAVSYGQHGYSVVAYLPQPTGNGNALIISGTDMSSIGGGGRFVTDEAAISRLLASLKVPADGRIPYFEALLKTKLLVDTAPGYELLAIRKPKL